MMLAVGNARPRTVELPRDEMAFRMRYQRLLLARRITTVFRPGNRIHPNWRGYILGETVVARVIERPGSDAHGIPPLFNDLRIPIRIRGLEVKGLNEFTAEDFVGSSPDVMDVADLIAHLNEIYDTPIAAFAGQVTRIRFDYPS